MESISFFREYESPAITQIEIESEGVLCGSVDHGAIEGGESDGDL